MSNQYPNPQYPNHYGHAKPPKSRTGLKVLGGVLGSIVALGIIGAAIGGGDEEEPKEVATFVDERPTAVPTVPSTPRWSIPTTTAKPVKKDPYTSDGTWLVGPEIAPGQYKATVKTEDNWSESGYYAICMTLGCDAFGNGEMYDNNFFQGQAYLTIPEGAASIELNDVELTPVG